MRMSNHKSSENFTLLVRTLSFNRERSPLHLYGMASDSHPTTAEAKCSLHPHAIIPHSRCGMLGNGTNHLWSNCDINKLSLDWTQKLCDYLSHFICRL